LHVTLHGGIKFHDGVPLTANDVKDRYVITECEPSAGRSQGRNVTSILIGNYPDRDCDDFMSDDPTYGIKIVDDLNFIFKLSRPSKTFIDMLYTTRVAPSHILRKDDDTPRDMGKVDTPEDNIGTGPFVFVSYDRGSVFKVERNPDYWKTDPRNGNGQLPYLDGIHTFIIPDISTRFAAFRAGQIELTPVNSRSISFDQARVISNNMQGEATVSYGDKSRNNFLAFNHLRSPYDDVRVRRALFLAIDRKAICEVMVEGHCTFATHLPPVFPATFGDALNDEPGYRYPKDEDLAEAERLLDEAGLPRGEDGVRWVQELPVRPGGADEYVNLSLLFQAQFREIGVEMRLNPMELGAFDGRRRVRDYDVLPLGGIKNNLNALGNSGYWGPGNGYNCESPERDALFTAADTATDPLAYAEIVTDLETWLMDNMCAYTPIAWLEYPLGMWNNIKNHNPHVIREDHHNAMQVTWKEAGT
jgi:peptide/nickel transport system substrate-binding protein